MYVEKYLYIFQTEYVPGQATGYLCRQALG